MQQIAQNSWREKKTWQLRNVGRHFYEYRKWS